MPADEERCLSRRVHEIVVLTVGAAWHSDYELYAHSALAKVAGLSDSVIRALASGQSPALESEEETSAMNWRGHSHSRSPRRSRDKRTSGGRVRHQGCRRHRDPRWPVIGPRRKVYLDAGFTNRAESTVGLSSTFSTYVVMLSAGLTPTTRTMYGTFTPPTSR